MQPFQYDLRSSAAKGNSITHAAAAPSNLDVATTMRSAETELQNTIELRAMASEIAAPKPGSRRQSDQKTILKHFLKGILKGKLLAPKLGKSADNSLSQPWCSHSNTIYDLQLHKTIVLRMQPQHRATLTQPLQCDLQAQIPKHPITTHTQAHPKQLEATVTLRQKKNDKPTAVAPAAQTRYLSSPAAAHFTRKKHKVSCSGFLPKTEPLQHHAAIPMRSASTVACSHFTRKNTRFRAPASSPKQRPCNIMQPFQCDLQAQIPKHPITTHTQAHPKQLEATVTLRQKKKTTNRPQPHPPHRRGTFHRRLQPLYTEKHKVSCSGFLPTTEPLQHHAAIPMRSASTDSKTPYNYAHTSTPKAAWSHRYTAAKKNDQPTAAAPAAQTRYLSSSPAATLHGKTQGFVLRLPPHNRALATSCSHSNAICKHRFQNTL